MVWITEWPQMCYDIYTSYWCHRFSRHNPNYMTKPLFVLSLPHVTWKYHYLTLCRPIETQHLFSLWWCIWYTCTIQYICVRIQTTMILLLYFYHLIQWVHLHVRSLLLGWLPYCTSCTCLWWFVIFLSFLSKTRLSQVSSWPSFMSCPCFPFHSSNHGIMIHFHLITLLPFYFFSTLFHMNGYLLHTGHILYI